MNTEQRPFMAALAIAGTYLPRVKVVAVAVAGGLGPRPRVSSLLVTAHSVHIMYRWARSTALHHLRAAQGGYLRCTEPEPGAAARGTTNMSAQTLSKRCLSQTLA